MKQNKKLARFVSVTCSNQIALAPSFRELHKTGCIKVEGKLLFWQPRQRDNEKHHQVHLQKVSSFLRGEKNSLGSCVKSVVTPHAF